MIKKMYRQAADRLRHLSLYWKTWIITILTLVTTLIIFFLLFSLFAKKFLEANQQNKFDRNVNEIAHQIETNGLDDEFLSQYLLKGYTVIVTLKGQVIYPAYSRTQSLILTEEFQVPSIEGSTGVSALQNGTSSLSANKLVFYQENLLNVDVFYPVIIDPGEIKTILVGIIPYFILTGLVVAFGVSWLYSRYFVDKINHLNGLVHQMSTRSISSDYQGLKGDELQELKNNVYHMYQELETTFSQLNLEVERVQRLEADRQIFMRGATHELKTPIMAMMTTLAGMMEGIDGYEDQSFHLSQCYNRLQSMSRLVNEMLEISRLEAVVFAGETDLTKTTDEMLEVYAYMIADQELVLKLDQVSELKVKIPGRTLQKVISNLIGNSVKYSPSQSTIRIKSTSSSWEIRNALADASKLNLATIFDPFVSYEAEVEEETHERSHGLGLYIVAAILKQYDYDYACFIDAETGEFVFSMTFSEQQPLLIEGP